jgi:hypothetical protein
MCDRRELGEGYSGGESLGMGFDILISPMRGDWNGEGVLYENVRWDPGLDVDVSIGDDKSSKDKVYNFVLGFRGTSRAINPA